MKKKRILQYLAVITSMVALSIATPLVIRSASDWIVRRVSARNRAPETEETEETGQEIDIPVTENDTEEAVSEYGEQEEKETQEGPEPEIHPETKTGKAGRVEKETERTDAPGYYEPPVYASGEDEKLADKAAYEIMREKVMSEGEAANAYRDSFSPVYDELEEGMKDRFISGKEQLFHKELANYCFGHYNTTHEIVMVRFDALLEDTGTRATAILEFFTRDDLGNALHIPDLALCTHNRNTNAFVFFQSSGR